MLKRLKQQKNRLNEALLLGLLALPGVTHAASIETILNKAAAYLQGGLARSVGVLVIIGAGYLCLGKQMFPKEQLTWIIVGLGIIFGGGSLYSTLVG